MVNFWDGGEGGVGGDVGGGGGEGGVGGDVGGGGGEGSSSCLCEPTDH